MSGLATLLADLARGTVWHSTEAFLGGRMVRNGIQRACGHLGTLADV